jgi:hypothetical protein
MSTDETVLSPEYCEHIRSLSDERLDLLVSTPPLGQDLLEHAAFCRSCSSRLRQIRQRDFAALPPEEQARLNSWAADFVKRNFPQTA